MSGLGEKIKEVFSGHHHESHSSDVKTPDVDAPGAFPADEPAHSKLTKEAPGHANRDSAIDMAPKAHSGHQHHADPETEAKQATSAAGNYPYWGDLPKESERDAHPEGTATGLHSEDYPTSTGHSGLEKGALATGAGAGAAGAGYLAHEHSKTRDEAPPTATTSTTPAPYQKDLVDRTTAKPTASDNASTTAQVDPLEYPPKYDQGHGKYNEELAGAGLAGAAGAGYLAHKKREDNKEKELENKTPMTTATPSQIAPSSVDQRYAVAPATQQTTTTSPLSQDPKAAAAAPGEYHDYKKEEALAGGAGLAGLGAGAGYLASRNKHDDKARQEERPSTIAPSSVQRETTAGGFPTNSQADPTTSGGIHNTVVGAGSSEDPNARRFPLDSSSDNATTVGPQHGTGSNLGQQDVARDFGAPTSHGDREKQALAAAAGVGAGAGLIGAEEKHRHHNNKDKSLQPQETSNYQGTPAPSSQQRFSNTTTTTTTNTSATPVASQQPAQAAAQQAWSRQDPATAGAGYGQSQSQPHHKDDDRLKYGAVGAAAATAGAGATAAYYGQGKEHDQNPRSAESEKIAERALGSDGAAHPPAAAGSSGSGYDASQNSSARLGYVPAMANTGSASGNAAGSGGHAGAKVLHKCHQCGADNDITEYLNKEAVFRMGS